VNPLTAPGPLSGPEFSSYSPEDVQWLLTDISGATLEDSTPRREADIQSGRRHYSETLPFEYEPTDAYVAAYEAALATSTLAMAVAIKVLAQAIIAQREKGITLVSLARAGVPIGILLHRWLAMREGITAPHFAISIIRDRGIDVPALKYLLSTVSPESIQFVDGWTGKGVIAETLSEAVNEFQTSAVGAAFQALDAGLAVISDPLGVASIAATSTDLLIPSACLNSTVSGLISRTVLSADFIHPGMFHGAKFYRHLAGADRSVSFIDRITASFATAEDTDPLSVFDPVGSPVEPAAAEISRLMARYGVRDRNRIKPGIGETTRVLLRRIPELVVVRSNRIEDLAHVLVLARDRGIQVRVDDNMPFACIGVISDKSAAE
jgi:hypothetical protein